MNDATLKKIAAVKVTVTKGSHVCRIRATSNDPPRIGPTITMDGCKIGSAHVQVKSAGAKFSDEAAN